MTYDLGDLVLLAFATYVAGVFTGLALWRVFTNSRIEVPPNPADWWRRGDNPPEYRDD